MTDRVANKIRTITVVKKTPRDRMQSLLECRGGENFSVDELRELYGKNSSLILQTYQEFIAVADAEMLSKGKQLSCVEACAVVQVLRDLMQFNAAKISGSDWELAFWIKELPCYLHQENHIMVRRHAFDALMTLMEIRASLTSKSVVEMSEELLPFLQLLLSTLDWEYLRAVYGNLVSLPSSIAEVRRGRHDCVPPRARYSAAIGAVGDERERETILMLRRLVIDPLLAKDLTSTSADVWLGYLFQHLAPLFMPSIAHKSGLLSGATLHGFLSGPHRKIHPLFMELITSLAASKPMSSQVSSRLAETFGKSTEGTALALWTLIEGIRDPCPEFIHCGIKAMALLNNMVRSWTAGPLPMLEKHFDHIMLDVMENNTTNLLASFLTHSHKDPPVSAFQALLEAYCEWLMVIATSTGPQRNPISTTDFTLPEQIRLLAVQRLAVISSELAVLSHRKAGPVVDEVIAYATQCLWGSVIATTPPWTSLFLDLICPSLHRCEELIAEDADVSSQVAYVQRCWSAIVTLCIRVFIAPSSSKLIPFVWPTSPQVPSTSGLSAAHSALLEFRVRRTPVACEAISKLLATEMTASDAQKSFLCPTESLHNLMYHFTTDSYPAQKLKSATVTDICKMFLEAHRTGLLQIEPDSLMKTVAPYLLLQTRLSETGPNKVTTMALCAKDATEVLCELLVLPTTERWNHPATPNANPVLTPVVSVVALDRIRQILHDNRCNQIDGDDVSLRIMVALFRNSTTSSSGKASALLFSNPQFFPFQLLDELRWSSAALLEEKERGARPLVIPVTQQQQWLSQIIDGKIAAMNCFQWILAVDRRSESPSDVLLEHFCSSMVTSITTGRWPVAHTARIVGDIVVHQLRRSAAPDGCSETDRADSVRAGIQKVMVTLTDILLAGFSTLDSKNAVHQYAALDALLESLEDLLKPAASPAEGEQRRFYYSREFCLSLQRRIITSLSGAVLFHLQNWTLSQHAGDAVLMIIHLLGEYALRLGHLRRASYHPDAERYCVPLLQLVADVASLCMNGTTHEKYALGFPNGSAARITPISVSRVESAYQLMKENLEAQADGRRTSTMECALVMIPAPDESSRKWFGANTPKSNEQQAETIQPQQVVQAGMELIDSLIILSGAFPHPGPHSHIEVCDTIPGELPMRCERTAHFAVNNQQLLTLQCEALDSDEVHVRSSTMACSNGWKVWPTHAAPNQGDNVSVEVPAPVEPISVTRSAAVPTNELDSLLLDFEGTFSPPRELLEWCNPNAESPSLHLSNGRYCDLKTLTGFVPASPPKVSAVLPLESRNFVFSASHSFGIADVSELPKRNSSTANPEGTTIVSSTIASVVAAEQRPADCYQPVLGDENVDEIPTRTLIPPLPFLLRCSETGARSALIGVQEAVLDSFGVAADDSGSLYRFVGPRVEMTVRSCNTLPEAFSKSEAALCFVDNVAQMQKVLRETRNLMSGRSFVCLFVLPQPLIRGAVVMHVARQGEGAATLTPIADGTIGSFSVAGLLLRAALITAASPWRQPTGVAEAKRRISQRALRLLTIRATPALNLQSASGNTIKEGTVPVGSDTTALRWHQLLDPLLVPG